MCSSKSPFGWMLPVSRTIQSRISSACLPEQLDRAAQHRGPLGYGAAAHARWASARACAAAVDVVGRGHPEPPELRAGGRLHDGVVAAARRR